MSQYDQEVETRLQALEKGLAEVAAAVEGLANNPAPAPTASGGVEAVEAKLDDLIAKLGRKMTL